MCNSLLQFTFQFTEVKFTNLICDQRIIMTNVNIDIKENDLLRLDPRIVNILLRDKTTGENLIWGTDNYASLGKDYEENSFMRVELITGINGEVIKPRCEKSKDEQQLRIRQKAEVFTPTWICNVQNNLVDEAWFGKADVFNVVDGQVWYPTDKVVFSNKEEYGKGTWTDYISLVRLEVSCGEAPYLVSRYDTSTGKEISIPMRIGLLDRKLRVVNEKVKTRKSWLRYARKAVQSCYGYDFQGDNVFLARENVLQTVEDYYEAKFGEPLHIDQLLRFADIIVWNIFQMDGLKYTVPNSCDRVITEPKIEQPSVFDKSGKGIKALKMTKQVLFEEMDIPCPGCEGKGRHRGTYCKIKDWLAGHGKVIDFASLI